jgi:Icc protein
MLPDTYSRRRFLSASVAAAGSVACYPRCLRATARELPQVSFVVVTDTHVGYRGQESAARQWQETAAEIAQAEGDLVLHLGDVVDKQQESQYPIYLAGRKKIGKPVYEIPGNHDRPELFAKYLRESIDVAVDHKWIRFLLINNARVDSHDGFLSEEQISWIDRQCTEAAQVRRYVVICMHVPAHRNLPPDRAWYVKPDNGQGKLYEMLKGHAGRVIAMMHGHFHNGIRGWNDHAPVHEICFPSALYNQDRKLEERGAPGYNPIEFRPGYTLVTIGNGQMTLRYKPRGAELSVSRTCGLQLR